ncbi:DoxX family protein [Haloarcula onubensis]|uniref:DoxX family protein n=1 Tax=Haloarcula onubensis TaxID=2950539 RepID=A0ABU2FLL2_9EURY|nr:DoxX family protein [Halomicroarcula sp. S3CR25-11]MDS0281653.1 DoxX family protein [Halomicroarcula sp. S3CR25-11]
MNYQQTPLTDTVDVELDGPWTQYWLAFLRLVTGWFFFHAGITKVIENGLAFAAGPAYLKGMTGTALGPIPVWMGQNLAWFIEPGVPLFETLIGLALMVGALTRLAAVGGVIFMTLFWVGNAGFGHGLVNADLMALLLFVTVIVAGAGRYYGVDGVLEGTALVKRHPKLRYLMG